MDARDVTVRIAGEDDADVAVLAALRRAWIEENAGGSIDDASFERSFVSWWRAELPTRTFFVVELHGRPIGMANVKRYSRMPVPGRASGGWWGYVGNVFVLAEHRNDGAGRLLMDELIRWAGSRGAEHLRLAPSPLSKTFYARLGFDPGAVVELDPPPSRHSDG
jgi:GNAT superfamily N-acetyltransferase